MPTASVRHATTAEYYTDIENSAPDRLRKVFAIAS